jgi:hypothetical protein
MTVKGDVLGWIFAQKDPGIPYGIGLFDGGIDFFHQQFLGCCAKARRTFNKYNGHGMFPGRVEFVERTRCALRRIDREADRNSSVEPENSRHF